MLCRPRGWGSPLRLHPRPLAPGRAGGWPQAGVGWGRRRGQGRSRCWAGFAALPGRGKGHKLAHRSRAAPTIDCSAARGWRRRAAAKAGRCCRRTCPARRQAGSGRRPQSVPCRWGPCRGTQGRCCHCRHRSGWGCARAPRGRRVVLRLAGPPAPAPAAAPCPSGPALPWNAATSSVGSGTTPSPAAAPPLDGWHGPTAPRTAPRAAPGPDPFHRDRQRGEMRRRVLPSRCPHPYATKGLSLVFSSF